MELETTCTICRKPEAKEEHAFAHGRVSLRVAVNTMNGVRIVLCRECVRSIVGVDA